MSDQSKQWVMVPVEPTQAMLDAVMENDKPADHWVRVTRYGMADAYSAMLAAAPKVEREGLTPEVMNAVIQKLHDDWRDGRRSHVTAEAIGRAVEAAHGIAPSHGELKEQDQ